MSYEHELFEQHQDIVPKVLIKKYGSERNDDIIGRKHGMTLKDLYQTGYLLLLKAAKRFVEKEMAGDFFVFAWSWVSLGIIREMKHYGSLIHFPQSTTVEELESVTIISTDKSYTNHDDGVALIHLLPSEYSLENEVMRSLILKERLENLPEHQQRIIRLRLAGYNDVEVAKIIGRSMSYAQNHKFKALKALGINEKLPRGTYKRRSKSQLAQ